MRCRRRSRHPPTPHSPPAMPVRCPPTPTSGRAALSSPCPSRRSSLLQRHHLRPLLACRGEPRAERLDVAHPTREALDSTRPDTEEVARIHGPQLARAARERRSRWPDHRRLRVLATELEPPWHPPKRLGRRSLYPPELLARASHLVGASRFERPTTCAQGRCATRLRYAPSKGTRLRNTDSRPHATLTRLRRGRVGRRARARRAPG